MSDLKKEIAGVLRRLGTLAGPGNDSVRSKDLWQVAEELAPHEPKPAQAVEEWYEGQLVHEKINPHVGGAIAGICGTQVFFVCQNGYNHIHCRWRNELERGWAEEPYECDVFKPPGTEAYK